MPTRLKTLELRRHTANDGDVLTSAGVEAAVTIGRSLDSPYDLVISSGAQRATQAAACFLAGLGGQVPRGVVVDEGFRSAREDRWREIYAQKRRGNLKVFMDADRAFVEAEGKRFRDALFRVVRHIPDGGRVMIVGHSPMLEAAVWSVTGRLIAPLGTGAATLLTFSGGEFSLTE